MVWPQIVFWSQFEANTPDSWECNESKFCYAAPGHVITGNLKIIKIISDSTILSIISKGPRYRFPCHIGFKTYIRTKSVCKRTFLENKTAKMLSNANDLS